jgi:hypothetical protein
MKKKKKKGSTTVPIIIPLSRSLLKRAVITRVVMGSITPVTRRCGVIGRRRSTCANIIHVVLVKERVFVIVGMVTYTGGRMAIRGTTGTILGVPITVVIVQVMRRARGEGSLGMGSESGVRSLVWHGASATICAEVTDREDAGSYEKKAARMKLLAKVI